MDEIRTIPKGVPDRKPITLGRKIEFLEQENIGLEGVKVEFGYDPIDIEFREIRITDAFGRVFEIANVGPRERIEARVVSHLNTSQGDAK